MVDHRPLREVGDGAGGPWHGGHASESTSKIWCKSTAHRPAVSVPAVRPSGLSERHVTALSIRCSAISVC